jgi:hypothetical protein
MSSAPGISFRLGNQVALVQGRYADALYDLRARRIRRLSKKASSLVQSQVAGAPTPSAPDASEHQFLVNLASAGFLETRRAAGSLPYSNDWQWPTSLPPLRTLSFEVDARTDEGRSARISNWISEAITAFGLLSVVLVVSPGGVAAAERISGAARARSEHLVVEFLPLAGSEARSDNRQHRLEVVPEGEAVGLGSDDVRRVRALSQPMGPEAFSVSFAFFHLLDKFSESQGCLHFDAALRCFPDIAEADYGLSPDGGETRGLSELLQDPRLREYWASGKNERDKCRDCELRRACPNPIAARSRPEDLRSAPSNCGYDLPSGTWRHLP